MIRKSKFKQILSYDIIIPKANKADDFGPLIELAERELEHFEDDEADGMNEDEFKRFVEDVY